MQPGGPQPRTQRFRDVLASDPCTTPSPIEKLLGSLAGSDSRRINVQHRLVYQVFELEHVVKVIRMWTHYE
ncbi:MAG: Txe/YoeB family addiction module toxin [Dehalococcoidia bacterium]